jgi:hypothetical protein
LLIRQSGRKFNLTTASLRANILNFYANLSAPIGPKTGSVRWQSILSALEELKLATPVQATADKQ